MIGVREGAKKPIAAATTVAEIEAALARLSWPGAV